MKAHQHSLAALLCAGFIVGIQGATNVSAWIQTGGAEVRITVIGCVLRSQPPPGAVGNTVTPVGETKYVLSNITLVPPDSHTSTASAGSTATVLTEAVKMYRLDDSAGFPIAPHVGDRVQVTAVLVPTPPSPTGTAGRPEGPRVEATRAPMLRVESMQKISSDSTSCLQ